MCRRGLVGYLLFRLGCCDHWGLLLVGLQGIFLLGFLFCRGVVVHVGLVVVWVYGLGSVLLWVVWRVPGVVCCVGFLFC